MFCFGESTCLEQLCKQTLPRLGDLLEFLDAFQRIVKHICGTTTAAKHQTARMIRIEVQL